MTSLGQYGRDFATYNSKKLTRGREEVNILSANDDRYWQEKQRGRQMPRWQAFWSWIIALMFVVLVCDRQFVYKCLTTPARTDFIDFGTPEWNSAQKEVADTMADLARKERDGLLTIQDGCEAKAKVFGLCCRMQLPYQEYADAIIKHVHEVYLRTWQLPERASDRYKEACAKDDTFRRQLAADQWRRDFPFFDDQARQPYANQRPFDSTILWRFLRWLVKWYYLMTAPMLIIVLLDMWWRGQKVKQEVLCQPWRIARLCCLGAGGTLLISDSAGLAYAYHQLRRQYLADKPYDYRLTDSEEAALWRQAVEPVERFDELLEAVKASGIVAIRRPLFATSVAWLLGLSLCSPSKSQIDPVACAIVQVAESSETTAPVVPEMVSVTSQRQIVPTVEKLIAAILPRPVEAPVSQVIEVIVACRLEPESVFWATNRSRAPPVTVKANNTLRGTVLGCSLDERVVS